MGLLFMATKVSKGGSGHFNIWKIIRSRGGGWGGWEGDSVPSLTSDKQTNKKAEMTLNLEVGP